MHHDEPFSQRAQWAEGQPISELMSRALENPQLISLAAGFVDQASLPTEAVRSAMEAIFSDPALAQASLQYGTTAGLPELREAIIAETVRADGAAGRPPEMEQVIVTAGSNQLLHLTAEALLNPGDIVLCAAPTYFVYLGALANFGARSWSVASDEQGMIPQALEAAFEELESRDELHRVRALYLVPYFDNPRGVCTPFARRVELLAIVKRWTKRRKIYFLEDNAYRELRFEGPDEPSTRVADEEQDTVVVAGTFSKSFSPGVRVGWGILPRQLIEPIFNLKGNIDFGSPNLNQQIMVRVIAQGGLAPQVARLRAAYQKKRDAMLAALEEQFDQTEGVAWLRPRGGLYVWVTLPAEIDTGASSEFFQRCCAEGVLYVPGIHCFAADGAPRGRSSMRLSFGVQSPRSIGEGIAALRRAVDASLLEA